MARTKLHLAGPVSVIDAEGRDRTPYSMKARGILAVLGTARAYRVSRSKLQDKLWSDRSPEQGSASLRQALTEIRKRLGPMREILTSGPGWIGLDPDLLDVVLDPPADFVPGTFEFADDLDIRDAEFEDWLVVQRAHFDEVWSKRPKATETNIASKKSEPEPLCIVLCPASIGSDDLDRFSNLMLRDAVERAADLTPMRVFNDRAVQADFPNAIEVVSKGMFLGNEYALQVFLVHIASGRQLWSKTFQANKADLAASLKQISGEVTLALLHKPSDSASGISGRIVSLSDVFSFSPERLLRADECLALGPESHTSLALRAYIRNTQYLERFADNPPEALREASEMATRALEMAPLSATVLSIASIVAAQNNNFALSGDLAERAGRADPANPLARSSLSFALSVAGQSEQGHDEALRARKEPLSALSPASWAIFCAVTAVRARRFKEALRYSAISHGYAPSYRPALRFLGALNYKMGHFEEAEKALKKLQQLEPDFSLRLMASDDYPVASLRAAKLLDVTRSRLI